MAQFASAVNAVRCAQDIQHAIAQANESACVDRRMSLRIGINLGDVIEENGALFGDGVNVAARLQSLAEPGGILVSGSVHEQVKGRLSRLHLRGSAPGQEHRRTRQDLRGSRNPRRGTSASASSGFCAAGE